MTVRKTGCRSSKLAPSTGVCQAPEDSPLTMANMATWHSLAQLGKVEV